MADSEAGIKADFFGSFDGGFTGSGAPAFGDERLQAGIISGQLLR